MPESQPEPDVEVVAIAELYDAAFKALRREHRCRKNALEAVERMKRIVHEPTPREIAQLRFLDNGHTAAFLAAEEILVKLAELEGEEVQEDGGD